MIVEKNREMPVREAAAKPYSDNLEHLLASLALLDLRLLAEVQRVRLIQGAEGAGEFRGLFVSEGDIDAALSGTPSQHSSYDTVAEPISALIRQREAEITERTRSSLKAGVDLRIERLREQFGLGNFEVSTLVLCIAPEIDLKYEMLYAYIQEDVSKRRPTVNLALNLFCQDLSERVAWRNALAGGSSLTHHELVRLSEDSGGRQGALLGSSITPDSRIADYLLGSSAVETTLRPFVHVQDGQLSSWDDVVLPDDTRKRLIVAVNWLAQEQAHQSKTVLQLVGPGGAGKKTIAQAICHSLGRRLLVVNIKGLLAADSESVRLVALAFREALLQDAMLCLDEFHVLLDEDAQRQATLAAVHNSLGIHSDIVILAGEQHWRVEGSVKDRAFLTCRIPSPDFQERRSLWDMHLDGQRGRLTDEEVSTLAGRFRLQGGQIRRVVATARDMARFRPESDGQVTLEDLSAASRWHSNQRLTTLARKIEPGYSWDDIVLPADQKQQLREICSYFSNMALVYEGWGFQSKTGLGKGLNILFAGSSGTGKTMSADIMAGALGLDLYKIDLSGIISKYIGETEKNLDRIFREANDSNAILFFDEADSLFGKRSEVRDSHDRYANIEVSYLLQKMEEYQGIVILATNFRKNMDDAFVRRMHFVVEFPVPEEADRIEIWRRVFPGEAPVAEDVDLEFMARQFRIAGGNIKNIAVTSAFLAAEDRGLIGMEHVILATRREYQKMGRLLVESDFGKYYSLVKPHALV